MPLNPTCLLCERPRQHGRYCNPCYARVQGQHSQKSREELFWEKVDKDAPVSEFAPHLGACWIWVGARSPQGYGKVNHPGRPRGAHRYAYTIIVGDVPDGLDLDHLCRVRACVRPTHLQPVTRKENAQRGERGRMVTHCKSGHEFTDENTYRQRNGTRACRECHRQAERRRKRLAR